MSRKLILASASVLALALATPSLATDNPTTAERAASAKTMQTTQIDTHKIIGRDLLNTSNDKIGSIDSVMLGREGKVQAVIVNVGGFLGLGERNVAIDWADITVSQDDKKITTALTKDQLKALPEYKYAEDTKRGTAFEANGTTARSDVDHAKRGTAFEANGARRDTVVVRPGDKNSATVDVSSLAAYKSTAIVGAKAVTAQNENVGEVEELLIGANGLVRGALVSVGGFLGIGERNVVVDWRDLTITRDGSDLKVLVKLNKDQLKALPEYAENR
jgi:PRC-barrel domain